MRTFEKSCLECSQTFQAAVSEHNRGYAKFCSRTCSGTYNTRAYCARIQKPNATCAFCNERFYRKPSKLKLSKTGLYFCCREHKDRAQRVENGLTALQPSHYRDGKSDYRKIAFRNFAPTCSECGWDQYPEVLVVHHKDTDRSNNALANLKILCPRCHQIRHFLEGTGRFWNRKGTRGVEPLGRSPVDLVPS